MTFCLLIPAVLGQNSYAHDPIVTNVASKVRNMWSITDILEVLWLIAYNMFYKQTDHQINFE
jgi:nitric oxide reductase large subunit